MERLNLSAVKGYLRGWSYALICFCSILAGFFFLYAPILPFLFLQQSVYRRYTDVLFSTWEAFNTSLLELVYGVKIIVTGDSISGADDALILLNHPTRYDWNFFWPALFHASPSHNTKIILKESLRKTPGIGWIMSMTRFIYLRRNWNQDSVTLNTMMDYFNHTREDGPRQILLLPEGTTLSSTSTQKSNLFAEKNNLKKYKHVLHPRTSGFVHLAHGLMERNLLTSIYDLTIAYPDTVHLNEKDLLEGNLPERVHVHIVRYSLPQVPSTFIGLEKWIQEVWREKEKLLERFQETKEFFPLRQEQREPCKIKTLQPLCLVSWFLFLYFSLSWILFTIWAKVWVLGVALLFFFSENYTSGIQSLELNLHYGRGWKIRKPNSEEESQDDFEHLKED